MATRRRLKTMSDIRRFLAYVICQTEKKEIDLAMAGKIGYLLQILSRVVENSELEARIERLEQQIRR